MYIAEAVFSQIIIIKHVIHFLYLRKYEERFFKAVNHVCLAIKLIFKFEATRYHRTHSCVRVFFFLLHTCYIYITLFDISFSSSRGPTEIHSRIHPRVSSRLFYTYVHLRNATRRIRERRRRRNSRGSCFILPCYLWTYVNTGETSPSTIAYMCLWSCVHR